MRCNLHEVYFSTSSNKNKLSFSAQNLNNTKTNDANLNSVKLAWGPALSSDKIETQVGNFYKVDEHFYRGAQPGIDETKGGLIDYAKLKHDLKYLRDKFNITVVLNLRNPNDNNTKHIELEKQAIEELNNEAKLINLKNPLSNIPKIQGINLPMYAEDIVRSEQVEKIMEYFKEYSDKNIFVHCRSGNDRTGVVTALRRIWKSGMEKGVSFKDIQQEMIKCGHNQNWYPKLISSLAACVRYMGITPEYSNIINASGQKNFLSNFYQNNRLFIKSLAFGK